MAIQLPKFNIAQIILQQAKYLAINSPMVKVRYYGLWFKGYHLAAERAQIGVFKKYEKIIQPFLGLLISFS